MTTEEQKLLARWRDYYRHQSKTDSCPTCAVTLAAGGRRHERRCLWAMTRRLTLDAGVISSFQ